MRVLEIALLVPITLLPFIKVRVLNRANKKSVLGLLFSILLLHLFLEGCRWQLIPGYFLFAVIAIWIANSKTNGTKRSIALTLLAYIPLIIFLFISWVLPYLLPVFTLPSPTGTYNVGAQDIYLKLDRPEIITSDKTDERELALKIWYPSSETSDQRDEYLDEGSRQGFAMKYGLPSFSMDYLNYIKTHVYKNVSVEEDLFPVLIFSHCFNSKATGYYALLSEIASHGFIIININHTYESVGSTFGDGRIKFFDREYSASKNTPEAWDKVSKIIEAYDQNLSFEDRHPVVKNALRNHHSADMIKRWSQDISDVIDQLQTWNQKGFLKGHLNLQKIGAFGHSRGGAAAGEALLFDPRIVAGANLDGAHWGIIVDTIFHKPFLYLSSDWPADHQDLNQHAYINKSTSYFYNAKLLESGHSNFMDIPYMVRLKPLNEAGKIEQGLAVGITSDLVVSFFNKHLKKGSTKIEAVANRYSSLEIEIHKGDSIINK